MYSPAAPQAQCTAATCNVDLSFALSVQNPVGLAANKALEEYEDPIQLSLVGNALSGYLRQCKVVPEYKVASTKDGEKIDFTLRFACGGLEGWRARGRSWSGTVAARGGLESACFL